MDLDLIKQAIGELVSASQNAIPMDMSYSPEIPSFSSMFNMPSSSTSTSTSLSSISSSSFSSPGQSEDTSHTLGTSDPAEEQKSSLGGGAIAGIVIGCLVFAPVIAIGVISM
ncbi:L-type lectin-domain containing receptor kinase S.1 [Histomonas meleagridis]|uniref:L-type lectin-domain containing receptor kinase S.1 n=1 Tax=Histomonas meleagridis TaxID=135588 RepID=UPI00355A160A|nr:L-type lectin-domain containing receptor kinase S.1 [Histomonas meleagridis]